MVKKPTTVDAKGLPTAPKIPTTTTAAKVTASAFILSYAFLYINPVLGIISLSISLVMASLRPLCGVHYISDVVAGILISSIIGILFFFIF